MCGIAGYIGSDNAPTVLFDMLARLEYRGYDSAGIAYLSNGVIEIPKDKGKVEEVRIILQPENLKSNIGLAHTRWATHGVPSRLNSHPHKDCSGDFVVAHNGIIENYSDLREELILEGHKFTSDTDTEVIAHLIEKYYVDDVLNAFEKTLIRLKGSYAIVGLSTHEPNKLFIARYESPLIIGVGDKINFIASDAPAFLEYTRNAIILEDNEYGYITKDSYFFKNLVSQDPVEKKTIKIDWDITDAQKSGYQHFMLKEIYEEPKAAENALCEMDAIKSVAKKIAAKKRIYFLGCGTAYHAGLYGKYILENYGINANACIASEFRYSKVKTIDEDCAVIAVSQSGETADTLAALKKAKENGAYVCALVNVVGSSMTRYADDVIHTRSGPEISVASTKAYIGHLVSAGALCGHICLERGKDSSELIDELEGLSSKISLILDSSKVKELAESVADISTFFFVGRRQHYPSALEGALKLKEISYVHAEGYPAGELKHGPLALMDDKVTVIALMPSDELKPKVESNISEIKARGAKVIRVGVDEELNIPKTHPLLEPILSIVPLHLFAYYISVLKGIDPDKPRNLAKSVTVE